MKLVWLLLLALTAPVSQHAQVSDPRIELLRRSIEIVEKINSLPINFQNIAELIYPGIEFNFKGDKLTVVAIK